MSRGFAPDEELIRRLPLPQAQLARHAQNAKTPLERTLAAYFLWESALKLLGGTAVVAFAEHPSPDPALAEMLQALARPALGHWWGIARSLVPALAGAGDEGFRAVGEALLGKARDDLPRAAGLDAVLGELLDGAGGARSTVRVRDLFDRLVQFRNRYIGHGAPGQLAPDWYGRLGPALLAGVTELLGRLDVLAGRRLLYLAEVRRLPAGGWRLERYELTGESPRRLDPLDLPESASPPAAPGATLPRTRCLSRPDRAAPTAGFRHGRRGRIGRRGAVPERPPGPAADGVPRLPQRPGGGAPGPRRRAARVAGPGAEDAGCRGRGGRLGGTLPGRRPSDRYRGRRPAAPGGV